VVVVHCGLRFFLPFLRGRGASRARAGMEMMLRRSAKASFWPIRRTRRLGGNR